jgi:hypothetical protein
MNPHDLVAFFDFLLGIAFVECFDPNQGGGLCRMPVDVARAGGDAADGNVFLKREARDFVNGMAGEIPDLDVAREALEGDDVGIWR